MAWILSPLLLLILSAGASTSEFELLDVPFFFIVCLAKVLLCTLFGTHAGPQVVLDPESRLIPVGVEALFTCKFLDVTRPAPYWEINGIKATVNFTKMELRAQGFFIEQEWTDSDGITVLTMRVNGSSQLHNSTIQCKTFLEDINSEIATLLIIEGI